MTADTARTAEALAADLRALGVATNRQTGEHLYLSHRTVATHLYRIFPKLGISTRTPT
jgi:DNA-binding CsgD family transcriptional regulator